MRAWCSGQFRSNHFPTGAVANWISSGWRAPAEVLTRLCGKCRADFDLGTTQFEVMHRQKVGGTPRDDPSL
jgi:hypothetical protein